MSVNFSNTNSIWASVLVETLHRLGLHTAIICPGSRSAPLAVAFAQHPQIEAIPVLDERSAAFFALGLARRTGIPTVLVCTSGTAGANFYPAVIEANESRVPLLILTADRPPELRACNSGQTIDQQKLYGTFPNWYSELSIPSLELSQLAYLRQTLIHAWGRSLHPIPGVVHLNLPFRDPLAPTPQPEAQAFADQFPAHFFDFIQPPSVQAQFNQFLPAQTRSNQFPPSPSVQTRLIALPHSLIPSLPIPPDWLHTQRGIIIAGVAQPRSPKLYCEAIAHLAKTLGFPVLAEGLSPVRNYADLNPYLISTYDLILRNEAWAKQLTPEIVIRIGEMPTSKRLREWLVATQPRQWVVDLGDRNLDPLHLQTIHLPVAIESLVAATLNPANRSNLAQAPKTASYLQAWCRAEVYVRDRIDQTLSQTEELTESKVAWLLSRCLPDETPLFISNSMPVRDVEWFWCPRSSAIQPWFNRGANGIDGTLSTALGVAHRNQSSVLLTGDLALLHDTNGFLLTKSLVGHLTILLVNNNGGGIFGMLPIAQFNPPFEEFFVTPQHINIAQLCAAYEVEYQQIKDWDQLSAYLNPLPDKGVRVLEIGTHRTKDAQWRQHFFAQFAREMPLLNSDILS
ncbi:2-succinyl-5-enolpyruvyl-6-hydroxy-3-cyclohexene-1-carboxylic-acid synthase [Oscillatoria sp. FACHB-1407]|uniref:2-succinyl-5-enolpyruvyl-6-hydroxy-3- cyclohexene-1-carboxylic-acid synthase n=1 Tax=Oscillatoria sp. FACHB-1407 TaxID=2692847 RepID=UPI0016881F69|nr:2-succinyl-5-enolpyruvyl-6-hydroxy-3-cyclohexene-1-carboxylic-acid synthase [Oscillatoria sp. FACHB-1407]MBD2464400.1 2-succinyl-5-enolpyruvyl-6-hydroxy-3-cyclohexene-1-carboxylic-acid synthase [Oscillatoria sp. FACHB-1407]